MFSNVALLLFFLIVEDADPKCHVSITTGIPHDVTNFFFGSNPFFIWGVEGYIMVKNSYS